MYMYTYVYVHMYMYVRCLSHAASLFHSINYKSKEDTGHPASVECMAKSLLDLEEID